MRDLAAQADDPARIFPGVSRADIPDAPAAALTDHVGGLDELRVFLAIIG